MPRVSQANNKTQPHDGDVLEFIAEVTNQGRREDAYQLLEIMREVTGLEAQMWGPSIIGFGKYHYVYESGREGDSFLAGFSPRKANLVVYIMPGFSAHADLLAKLGKYRTGSSCLYLGRLKSVDLDVLRQLISKSMQIMKRKYPSPSPGGKSRKK
jgi:hypothetical protein